MTYYEAFIDVDELQILLNLLDGSIRVKYPFYDFTMVSATVKDKDIGLEVSCSESDFNLCLSEFGEHQREMPCYDDLIDALFCSGILKYRNHWEIENLIDSIRKWPPGRRACFIPDTNLFYHGFFSNYQKIHANEIILLKTVLDEVNNAQGKKYKDSMGKEIKGKIRFQPELFDEFDNRRRKQSRCAQYIALQEIQKILSEVLDIIDGVSESTYDNDENDAIIVETAKKIFEEGHPDLYLLTADKGLADRCESISLPHIFLQVPRFVEPVNCSYPAFRKLIAMLSYIFGVIKVNTVAIYGEFHKTEMNQGFCLKLVFQNKSLYDDFQKHVHLCRKINELKIPEGM